MLSRTIVILSGVVAAATVLTADSPSALKDVAPPRLKIGVALNQALGDGTDTAGIAIVTSQFNTISPENVLKWGPVHPAADCYTSRPA